MEILEIDSVLTSAIETIMNNKYRICNIFYIQSSVILKNSEYLLVPL